MSGDSIPMTPHGLRKLKDELKHLQSVERGKISREIEVARAHGDLRENAEYHAAKEKQSHIEGRILTLGDWIARSEVIDPAKLGGDKVIFGATVELTDPETDKSISYRLVGETEADLKKRWIAVTSPVARALIGKKVGDIATVNSPGGVRELEVVKIFFEDPQDDAPPSEG
ncbi:transcription elongation factor GreA [Corallococcus sp. BB11-1]|uniref:transcription elongation factor GreA n=1 Tax=Corallococcus sp. BB11-1 TaxID=2996783 RepID=UPI00227030D4|nr:transcription elongation factor GreA [Corallococcus sp. BB11-1]MCY1030696.1 transcription elongation factor GreA [Corallococcus sp. BB11-1]